MSVTRPTIVEIPEHEFAASNPCSRVIVHENSRKYGCATLSASYCMFLSWRSDLVQPVLSLEPVGDALWMGVDQRVVCVTAQGAIRFSIGLLTPLLNIQQAADCSIIICDSQIVVVNHDHSIRAICDVANVPDEVELLEGQLRVVFVNGEEETFCI